jgi:hypothetical protein
MTNFTILNLVGRHKYVVKACQELYSQVVKTPADKIKVFTTFTNPVTMRPVLRSLVCKNSFDPKQNYNLIINAFPSTSVNNLIDLNNYVTYKSRGIYQNINYFVLPEHFDNNDFVQSSLFKNPIYTDVFEINEPDKFKKVEAKTQRDVINHFNDKLDHFFV